MGWPSNRISPLRGRSKPETVRKVVVLPAPFAPIRVTTCPASTFNEMSFRVRMLP